MRVTDQSRAESFPNGPAGRQGPRAEHLGLDPESSGPWSSAPLGSPCRSTAARTATALVTRTRNGPPWPATARSRYRPADTQPGGRPARPSHCKASAKQSRTAAAYPHHSTGLNLLGGASPAAGSPTRQVSALARPSRVRHAPGVLSEGERRRFDQIAAELRQDKDLARLEGNNRPQARRKSRRVRRRTLLEWAEQRFDERLRRDRAG